ncbi:conserved Plasmodium protein, unknown function [Plasmodium ovale]|uniref:Uncharacterized protein n=2 Tax=Plasmodium ovale TaxID=36330 RepID=A0A1A8VSZ6_PLAOA|nr:conserved Plasmodium protein, unknown function [Plasmodium ovale curtisi]SBS91179.1 conserved Plasmodium protein, unknown function [Plasmodium ovale curtisi]SCP04570.1 conserved Plasmodium protein, unknown function [Plasmodium ovale]
MNEKNDIEIVRSDYVNDKLLKEVNLKERFTSNELVEHGRFVNPSEQDVTSEGFPVNDNKEREDGEKTKGSSFLTRCFNKIVNFSSDALGNDGQGNTTDAEGAAPLGTPPVVGKIEPYGEHRENVNENTNFMEGRSDELEIGANNAVGDKKEEVDITHLPHSTHSEASFVKDEYAQVISGMVSFNKTIIDLNMGRGELYMSDGELAFISCLILKNGYRFCLVDDSKKKKKREFVKMEEFVTDLKKSKSDVSGNDYPTNQSVNNFSSNIPNDITKHGIVKQVNTQGESNSIINFMKNEEVTRIDKANNSIQEDIMGIDDNGNVKDIKKEISIEEKEKIELYDEILIQLKKTYYDQILNIENNFKNLENKIENNNIFHFNCIMEKLKNRKYENILLIYNDIYIYLNNLLFLSKPSSYIWMKLHELSAQLTNTISTIQQGKRDGKDLWKTQTLYSNSVELEQEKKKETTRGSDTIEQSINEEEKLAFQLLLGKLHQDIHFELFRKFKSKAVWKTLEGGEIELDDKLTKADVFREMYNWCKLQLDLKSKRSDESESESDSSKDSY